jgi:hypothetical protein
MQTQTIQTTQAISKPSHTVTLTYTANLFGAIDELIACLPSNSKILSSWSKKGNTLTTLISNLEPEDISFLKLKFQLEVTEKT